MNTSKKWVLGFLILLTAILIVFSVPTIIIDPFFHYHQPLPSLAYQINNERYQNNGILKNFDYDAIITGTSMTQNFKASEFDSLFGVTSVKVPFSGATYKEINAHLTVAESYNSEIRIILRGLDYHRLLDAADDMRYEENSYPWYLYDANPFNDVSYIFNKSILCENTRKVIRHTQDGNVTTDFDTYGNWMDDYTFGKNAIEEDYIRPADMSHKNLQLTEQDYTNIQENFSQNVTNLAQANPQTEFYLFFTPYSIYYWDSLYRTGTLSRQLAAEKCAIEAMLPYDNIHLFSFFTEYDMICNADNYKDTMHYSEEINSQILVWMHDDIHELTIDNYESYCKDMETFYTNYDYDKLFSSD